MTEDELREMERMWADGTSLKVMARRMGYTMEHLGFVMRQDRARFPKRRKSFTQEERNHWADRVLSGELTPRRAAELAGCGASTVHKWAKEREGRAMTPTEKAKRSDALYYETVSVNRRVLCDMVANREADLEDAKAESEHMRLKALAVTGELQEENERLKAENAKLMETLQRRTEQFEGMAEMWAERGYKNFKLRELVRDLWEGYNDPRCEECHLKDTPTCADCPICAREASVIDRMRELEVEVDE